MVPDKAALSTVCGDYLLPTTPTARELQHVSHTSVLVTKFKHDLGWSCGAKHVETYNTQMQQDKALHVRSPGLHLLRDAAHIDACAAHGGGLYYAHLRKSQGRKSAEQDGYYLGQHAESASCGEITVSVATCYGPTVQSSRYLANDVDRAVFSCCRAVRVWCAQQHPARNTHLNVVGGRPTGTRYSSATTADYKIVKVLR